MGTEQSMLLESELWDDVGNVSCVTLQMGFFSLSLFKDEDTKFFSLKRGQGKKNAQREGKRCRMIQNQGTLLMHWKIVELSSLKITQGMEGSGGEKTSLWSQELGFQSWLYPNHLGDLGQVTFPE